ncbi:hypothetical protein ACIBI4_04570 [Streptomyces sp. NPDC050418]|uniref:hypothetical protein n=1 Tax=Streptomyces sp. NPDC050418 TaxID=3365612 RepID=UPI003790A056
MVLVLLGLWDLIAMMIAASSRHRMRPKSFRLLVASLLCAPVVWIVPGLAGGGATLSHLVIDAVFVLNLLPVPEPAPPPGTWSG